MLDPRSESLLRWWFRQVAFERSTMAATLDRADMYLTPIRERAKERNRELAPLRFARKPDEDWDVDPITAYPTAETRSPAGYIPNDADLTRAAEVGRRLMAMERAGAANDIAILGLYYGLVGDHFAEREQHEGPMPRLYALLHVTRTTYLYIQTTR